VAAPKEVGRRLGIPREEREHLEQIQMLSPVDRVGVDRRSALKGGLPRRDRYEDCRHRKNHRKPKSEIIWCPGHLFPPGTTEVARSILRAKSGELCELLHTQHHHIFMDAIKDLYQTPICCPCPYRLRGWYWFGIVVFALAILVIWYMEVVR
jgi:hypothetical protein